MTTLALPLPWTEPETTRFTKRVSLFVRRGLSPDWSEHLADRLVERDRERDDRRCCIECSHLQKSGHCFAAAQGWIHGASRRLEPVRDVLHRCERFEWQHP